MENKGFWITYVTYIILFIADISTTLMNKHLLEFVELNPLYRWFGSLIPIIILNLVFIYGFYKMYHGKKTSNFNRYIIILLMMVVIVVRIIAINNAMTWYNAGDVDIEAVKATYTSDVIYAAQLYYAVLMYSPILFCILTFFLWYIDHRTRRKKEEKT